MSTGRKRRPANTSARQLGQEALPLAPPAARVDEPAPAQLEQPGKPVPAEAPERQAAPPPQRPPSHGEVLWVQCEDCGGGRHVDAAGRHGAMPVRAVTLEGHPAWPRCQHVVPYWENCRGTAVSPPCCMEATP